MEHFNATEVLPSDLIAQAWEEYEENYQILIESVDILRNKILSLDKVDQLTDLSYRNLVRFIRSRKLNVSKALKASIQHARFSLDNKDWCCNVTAKEFEIFNDYCHVLLNPDSTGRLVVIFEMKALFQIPQKYFDENPMAMVRFYFWFLETISYNIYVQVCGLIIIQNFDGLTFWEHIQLQTFINLYDRQIMMNYFTGCLGFRLKGLIFYKEPYLLSIFMSMILPFIPKKINERIIFCGNEIDSMKLFVSDVSILPVSLGGELLDDIKPNWIKSLIAE